MVILDYLVTIHMFSCYNVQVGWRLSNANIVKLCAFTRSRKKSMLHYFIVLGQAMIDYQQVGTISANGEREIGELIARAMEKVGKEGVITVSVSELSNPLSCCISQMTE